MIFFDVGFEQLSGNAKVIYLLVCLSFAAFFLFTFLANNSNEKKVTSVIYNFIPLIFPFNMYGRGKVYSWLSLISITLFLTGILVFELNYTLVD